MASITSPTAEFIWNRAQRKGVGPEHFVNPASGEVMDSTDEVLEYINDDILPDIQEAVNQAVDTVARTVDFPFTFDLLKIVYPNRTDLQITEQVDNQQGRLQKVILYFSLAELFDNVASTNPFFAAQVDRYRTWGNEELEKALVWIREIIGLTPDGQNAGLSGFGMIEVNTDPPPILDEFGRILPLGF